MRDSSGSRAVAVPVSVDIGIGRRKALPLSIADQ